MATDFFGNHCGHPGCDRCDFYSTAGLETHPRSKKHTIALLKGKTCKLHRLPTQAEPAKSSNDHAMFQIQQIMLLRYHKKKQLNQNNQDSPIQNHRMLSYQWGQKPNKFQGMTMKLRWRLSESMMHQCPIMIENGRKSSGRRSWCAKSWAEPFQVIHFLDLGALSMRLWVSQYGTVYHSNRSCRYLTAPTTGQAMIHDWCSMCREDSARTGIIPGRGATILLTGWRSDFHTNVLCERSERNRSFALCTECLGNM